MQAVEDLSKKTDMLGACKALNVAPSTLYRHRRPAQEGTRPRPRPSRALTDAEEQKVLATLNAPYFVDKSPACVHAELIDSKIYLCSVRTMYRTLARHKMVRERRNQLQHPVYTKPELLAQRANQLWSWDITKLKGDRPYKYYYLYTMIDVYSRFVVGWLVAECESNTLARCLMSEACSTEKIQPGTLTIHADNGAPMVAKPVAWMLEAMGVSKTHSRPHVSNDNPYIESHFKTLKYRPTFPKTFGSLEDARGFLKHFYQWYNHEHRHSGIAYLTPHSVHQGRGPQYLAKRTEALQLAYEAHPERFVRGPSRPNALPESVWINGPASRATTEANMDPKHLQTGNDPQANRAGGILY
jgi:putative transposase